MSDKIRISGGGCGFFGLMFLVFLGLKLAKIGVVATWSWWWIFVPLWGPTALIFGILLIILIIAGVGLGLAALFSK